MKQIIFAIISFVGFTLNTYANGYCDGRSSQQAINQCYRDILQTNNAQLTKNYQKLLNSSKLTPLQRQQLQEYQLAWENQVNNQCKSNQCIEKSLISRNNLLIGEYNKINK